MKSTITDVAKRAGVSIKTVSRVMNKEANVTEATRDKVLEAAKALKYAPNIAARRLAGSKSYLIALLYDIPSPGYVANIQKGATDACREKGYHLVVEPLDFDDPTILENVEGLIRRLPVDGVILTPPLCDNGEIVSILTRNNIDYVPVAPSASHGDTPIVKMDDVKAAREMTNYLISLGHTDIAFVKGHPHHSASALRFEGYREAMRSAGLRINPDWIRDGEFTYKSGADAAREIFSLDAKPTAIFSSNDDMAMGIISAARECGLSIPDDISVCGFDDVPSAKIVWPALTTVQQPVIAMGRQAAQLLLEDAPETDQIIHNMEHKLIIRDSTRQID